MLARSIRINALGSKQSALTLHWRSESKTCMETGRHAKPGPRTDKLDLTRYKLSALNFIVKGVINLQKPEDARSEAVATLFNPFISFRWEAWADNRHCSRWSVMAPSRMRKFGLQTASILSAEWPKLVRAWQKFKGNSPAVKISTPRLEHIFSCREKLMSVTRSTLSKRKEVKVYFWGDQV